MKGQQVRNMVRDVVVELINQENEFLVLKSRLEDNGVLLKLESPAYNALSNITKSQSESEIEFLTTISTDENGVPSEDGIILKEGQTIDDARAEDIEKIVDNIIQSYK